MRFAYSDRVVLVGRVAVLGLLLFLLACVPGQQVVGRPAAVLGPMESTTAWGISYLSLDLLYTDFGYPEEIDIDVLLFHVAHSFSLGDRIEATLGLNTLAPFVGMRYQLVGSPAQTPIEEREGRSGFDLSVELGASAPFAGFPVTDPLTEVHAGLHVSRPMHRVTPYMAVRYHHINWPIDIESEDQHIAGFFGLDFHGPEAARLFSLEVFAGRSPNGRSDDPYIPSFETWGVNFLVRPRGK